jgi:hypothetical protein
MDSRENRDRSEAGDSARRDRAAGQAGARQLARAVAEREQGRRRLTAATVTASFASVAVAGAVLVVLPGATHAAVKDPGTSSGKSSSSDSTGSSGTSSAGTGSSSSSSSSSNSSSNSSTLQSPASSPVQSNGSASSTSGGTS